MTSLHDMILSNKLGFQRGGPALHSGSLAHGLQRNIYIPSPSPPQYSKDRAYSIESKSSLSMESPKHAIVVASEPMDAAPEVDSQLSSILYDVSQQVQVGMEGLLKMINEIDAHSSEVMEEMEKCKESAIERKKAIEEETECFQKAAYAVLDMLNNGGDKQQMLLELDNDREFCGNSGHCIKL
ncbi:hypothetical protein Ancab_022787 [Ancistrocladus abbreviatus]